MGDECGAGDEDSGDGRDGRLHVEIEVGATLVGVIGTESMLAIAIAADGLCWQQPCCARCGGRSQTTRAARDVTRRQMSRIGVRTLTHMSQHGFVYSSSLNPARTMMGNSLLTYEGEADDVGIELEQTHEGLILSDGWLSISIKLFPLWPPSLAMSFKEHVQTTFEIKPSRCPPTCRISRVSFQSPHNLGTRLASR